MALIFGKNEWIKIFTKKSLANEWLGQKVIIIIIWMVLVWQIADDSPNLPNFSPTKHSQYMVQYITLLYLL